MSTYKFTIVNLFNASISSYVTVKANDLKEAKTKVQQYAPFYKMLDCIESNDIGIINHKF